LQRYGETKLEDVFHITDRLAQDSARRRISVNVEKVYSLTEAQQALAHFAQGTRGKIVLSLG
jgi:NADPH:quinone reductase-like Zn-dependent oxidoreductase